VLVAVADGVAVAELVGSGVSVLVAVAGAVVVAVFVGADVALGSTGVTVGSPPRSQPQAAIVKEARSRRITSVRFIAG
jgi:hypothetical protein